MVVALGDLHPRRSQSDTVHLGAVLDWLRMAQDATGCHGVAAAYDVSSGWQAPYPETTGYLVGTFLHHAEMFGDSTSRQRALAMGNYLLGVQNSDGSFPGGPQLPGKWVFDSGQALLGLVALAETTGDDRFATAAGRAGRWLTDAQDDEGCWTRYNLGGEPHAYDARVAWALARAGVVLGEERFCRCARRAIAWVCRQQQPNGWIRYMGFDQRTDPLTHTIAYTIEGLLEAALVLDDSGEAWTAARALAEAMAIAYRLPGSGARLRRAGHLAGTFRPDWTSTDRYACVTGSAQVALCCRRLDAVESHSDLRSFADELVDTVMSAQPLTPWPAGVRGGLPGSAPVWGTYGSFRYPNWAAKFAADLLLDRHPGALPRQRLS
jgi:hypothetical protein